MSKPWKAAIIGLSLGVGIALLILLVKAVVDEGHDATHIKSLLAHEEQRLNEQAAGVKVGLDILCKLKKYDLTTGIPALKARRAPGPEHDAVRALILERALLLVLSIPSSANCLAEPAPSITKKRLSPAHNAKVLEHELRVLESVKIAPAPQPPHATPRIEREGVKREGIKRQAAKRPGHRVIPRPSPVSPVQPVAPSPVTIPEPRPPPQSTPPAPTTPSPLPELPKKEPPKAPPERPVEPPREPPVAKKRGPLGICIEVLSLKVLCE